MQKLIDSWRTRKLTLLGKITVIKSLILPIIIYSASVLHIPDDCIKIINKMLYHFLWGNRDKIKRNIMINSFENGGLKMIDIECHLHALKASWISRIYNGNDNLWTVIPLYYFEKSAMSLFTLMNVDTVTKLPQLQVLSKFYQEVLIGYMRSNKPTPIQTNDDLYNQFLWGNKSFLVNGKCIFSRSFINAGIYKVGDVLLDNGFVNENVYHMLQDKRQYFRTISLIKSALKPYKAIRFMEDIPMLLPINLPTTIPKRKCKFYYEKLVEQKCTANNCTNKWSEKLNSNVSYDTLYRNKMSSNFETYITEFNFKLFNFILATGKICSSGTKRIQQVAFIATQMFMMNTIYSMIVHILGIYG